jgi:hypothetical protein
MQALQIKSLRAQPDKNNQPTTANDQSHQRSITMQAFYIKSLRAQPERYCMNIRQQHQQHQQQQQQHQKVQVTHGSHRGKYIGCTQARETGKQSWSHSSHGDADCVQTQETGKHSRLHFKIWRCWAASSVCSATGTFMKPPGSFPRVVIGAFFFCLEWLDNAVSGAACEA